MFILNFKFNSVNSLIKKYYFNGYSKITSVEIDIYLQCTYFSANLQFITFVFFIESHQVKYFVANIFFFNYMKIFVTNLFSLTTYIKRNIFLH